MIRRETVALMLVSLIAMLMLLGFGVRAHAEAPAQTMYVAVKQDTKLNCREAPTKESKVLFTLWRGCVVTVLEYQDEWALVN